MRRFLSTAGNVWGFVVADDATNEGCVLRGGSDKNDRFEIRSYLRLFAVPVFLRTSVSG